MTSKKQKMDDVTASPHFLGLEVSSTLSPSSTPSQPFSSDTPIVSATTLNSSNHDQTSEVLLLEEHMQDLTSSLSRDDLMSLTMTLHSLLV